MNKQLKWNMIDENGVKCIVTDLSYNTKVDKNCPWIGTVLYNPSVYCCSSRTPTLCVDFSFEVRVGRSDMTSLAWLKKVVDEKPAKEGRRDAIHCVKIENGLGTSTNGYIALTAPVSEEALPSGVYVIHKVKSSSVIVSDVSGVEFFNLSYVVDNQSYETVVQLKLGKADFPLFSDTYVFFEIETEKGKKLINLDAEYVGIALDGAIDASVYFNSYEDPVKIVAKHRGTGGVMTSFIMPLIQEKNVMERTEMLYNFPSGFYGNTKSKVRIFFTKKKMLE